MRPVLFYLALCLPTLLVTSGASGQSFDSVLQHMTTLPTNLDKVQYLEQQVDRLYQVQPAQALAYAQRADSLASLVDSLPLSLEIQRLQALPMRVMGDYEQAQTILQHAIGQIPPSPTSSALAAVRARISTNRAVLYRLQGDMLGSVAESQRAIRQLDSLMVRYPRFEAVSVLPIRCLQRFSHHPRSVGELRAQQSVLSSGFTD